MILRSFLVLSILFLFSGCFTYENFYEGLKYGQKQKEDRYPKQSDGIPQEKKDQTYQQYVDEVEKSKF